MPSSLHSWKAFTPVNRKELPFRGPFIAHDLALAAAIGWFFSVNFSVGSSYVRLVFLPSIQLSVLLAFNMQIFFDLVFFRLSHAVFLGVFTIRWNGILGVGDDLGHTCDPSDILWILLKLELGFYRRSISDHSWHPLRVADFIYRPLTVTFFLFVFTYMSCAHWFCHFANPCVNVQTYWSRVGGCYSVREVRAYGLPIFLITFVWIPSIIFSIISCKLYFAPFVSALFHFAQMFCPDLLYGYIMWSFVLNYTLAVTL